MRTFIALELPKEIKDSLADIQEQLRASAADVKWVKPENIHLTLKFLGDINEQQLTQIISILEEIGRDKLSFDISLSTLGAFPKITFPRVIWVGIDKGDNETQDIAQVLEEKIAKVGIPREDRPFSSHITIGRLRSGLNREKLTKNLEGLQKNFGKYKKEFLVTKITLFKSTLVPSGPIYETLKEANLKTT